MNPIIERPELTTLKPFDIHSENNELCVTLQKFWNIEEYERTHLCHAQADSGEFLVNIHFDENE